MSGQDALPLALAAFVEAHPDGWSHEEWLGLLHDLRQHGVSGDPGAIGDALERAHLEATLKRLGVKGLGPKRIEAIVDQFGRLYEARQARAEDFAALPTVPKALAEALEGALSGG